MFNWKIRFKNKKWVCAFISQILIIAQFIIAGLNSLGVIHFLLTDTAINQVLTVVNSIFIVLSMLGIVQDPTSKGYGDHQDTMKYEEPK